MFEECIELFDQYYRRQEPDPQFNTRAGVEFRRRLVQLDYLLAEIQQREEALRVYQMESQGRTLAALRALEALGLEWSSSWPQDIRDAFDAPYDHPISPTLVFEVETLTESFYFFAGRLRQLLRRDKSGQRLLPGLGDLPHEGAARVRDKLLEHFVPDANAPRGVAAHFATGGSKGPIIRLEQSEEVDPGLYANAEKLAWDLRNKLVAALR